MPEPYRAAVYYAPERHDPLWRRGCTWLGRDPESGEALAPPLLALAALTSDPRRYGLHATLKPPMRLTGSVDALAADVAALASLTRRFTLPPLQVAQLGSFIALVLSAPCPALSALADACVTRLDPHRLAETPAQQAARGAGRSDAQRELIARWGYPYVLAEWQFHVTLSNGFEHNELGGAARDYFADVLALPRQVESLALFVQPAPDAPFRLDRRLALAP